MERGGGGGQEQSGQFSLPKSCSSSKTQLISSPQCSSRDAPAPSPHLSFLSSLRSIPCASLVMSGFLSTYSVSDTIHVYFFFFFFSFLGRHPWHMEVPRSGAEPELQPPASATATATRIRATSATYTTAHGNARSLTHGARSGIKPASSGGS